MKLNIAILFGGNSVEHEISVISALQAFSNIDTDKYICYPVYIAKDGTMWSGDGFSDIEKYKDIPALLKKGHKVFMARDGEYVFLRTLSGKKLFRQKQIRIDCAFPIVHGLNVEDGTIQGYLHMLDIPYVGCDILSSALGMDKYVSKSVLREHGVPVLPCVHVYRDEYFDNTDDVTAKIEQLAYPVIIKPVDLGSSVGISVAHNKDELKTSLDLAFTFSGRIMAEPCVTDIQEINCSVLGDIHGAEASECEEPLNAGEILSYTDKYMSGGTKSGAKDGSSGMASLSRRIPANITDELRTQIRETAVKAFAALGCSGIVRIDFIVDKSKGEFYLNEVNTIPGSLAFYLWEPLGLKYKDLLTKLIGTALRTYREKKELTTSFETNVLSVSGLSGAKK